MARQLGQVACACGRSPFKPSNSPGGPIARQIVYGLKVHPEFGRGAKRTCEEPCRVGRDSAFAVHDLVDALDRNAQLSGELGLGNAQLCKELVA